MNRIAAVTSARIIEVDNVELRFDLISILMIHHVVVGNHRKVWIFKIIAVEAKALLYLLFDVVVNHCKGLTTTRCT